MQIIILLLCGYIGRLWPDLSMWFQALRLVNELPRHWRPSDRVSDWEWWTRRATSADVNWRPRPSLFLLGVGVIGSFISIVPLLNGTCDIHIVDVWTWCMLQDCQRLTLLAAVDWQHWRYGINNVYAFLLKLIVVNSVWVGSFCMV